MTANLLTVLKVRVAHVAPIFRVACGCSEVRVIFSFRVGCGSPEDIYALWCGGLGIT